MQGSKGLTKQKFSEGVLVSEKQHVCCTKCGPRPLCSGLGVSIGTELNVAVLVILKGHGQMHDIAGEKDAQAWLQDQCWHASHSGRAVLQAHLTSE